MSKNSFNVFIISLYNQIVNNFDSLLHQMKKYNIIYNKMDGYYTRDEMRFIIESYSTQLTDIIHSRVLANFIDQRTMKLINQYLIPIQMLIDNRNYEQVISNYQKIYDIISVDTSKLEN